MTRSGRKAARGLNSGVAPGGRSALRELARFVGGTMARPRVTFDALARQTSVWPAVSLVGLALVLGWLNMLLFATFGYDWLGTRRELLDPTFVGLFGRLRVGLEHWVPVFAVLDPLLGLVGLVLAPGLAQLLSKLWAGQGTFEQMVNTLAFALGVPSLLLRSLVELLSGVPMNLISGHPYWFTAAMAGEFGPVVAGLWNAYVIGIYSFGHDIWVLILGTLAIVRVQRIPAWGAALVMLVSYALWMYGIVATFVR